MKRFILILCIVAMLSVSLVSCGKTMTERAGELSLGMTYTQVAEIMGEDGEESETTAVYTWELEEGKILTVTFELPYEEGHENHSHTYPDDFTAIDIAIE